MFLNKTMLKKFIKSSFKWEGLTVGRIYGGLVVAGGTWITWTEEGYIPNWLKAVVMEHTGELPKQGYVFKAKKGEPIQYEIADNELYDLPSMNARCSQACTVTPVIIDKKGQGVQRILQQNGTLRMLTVSEERYKVIDLSELGEEHAPSGPAMSVDGILIYKNEHSAYAFTPLDNMYGAAEKIARHVEMIDFSEEER